MRLYDTGVVKSMTVMTHSHGVASSESRSTVPVEFVEFVIAFLVQPGQLLFIRNEPGDRCGRLIYLGYTIIYFFNLEFYLGATRMTNTIKILKRRDKEV